MKFDRTVWPTMPTSSAPAIPCRAHRPPFPRAPYPHPHTLPYTRYPRRKTPLRPGPDVAALYGAHRGPLLRLAEVARLGLRARLLDGATGQPLAGRVTLAAPPGAWPPQVRHNTTSCCGGRLN